MQQYNNLVSSILDRGISVEDRTGVGTIRLLDSPTLVFDLGLGFPIVNTKYTFFKGAAEELIWMLSGSTNVNDLNTIKHWWEPFAEPDGSLGYCYGYQLRYTTSVLTKPDGSIYQGTRVGTCMRQVDQIARLISEIVDNPYTRRHVITNWNAALRDDMNLPSCHGTVTQFFVDGDLLHCKTYQRSADVFLGVPVNICEYALLLHIIAEATNKRAGTLYYSFGDLHLYANHIDEAKILVSRKDEIPLPSLIIDTNISVGSLDVSDFKLRPEHFRLEGYKYLPKISAPMAV